MKKRIGKPEGVEVSVVEGVKEVVDPEGAEEGRRAWATA